MYGIYEKKSLTGQKKKNSKSSLPRTLYFHLVCKKWFLILNAITESESAFQVHKEIFHPHSHINIIFDHVCHSQKTRFFIALFLSILSPIVDVFSSVLSYRNEYRLAVQSNSLIQSNKTGHKQKRLFFKMYSKQITLTEHTQHTNPDQKGVKREDSQTQNGNWSMKRIAEQFQKKRDIFAHTPFKWMTSR